MRGRRKGLLIALAAMALFCACAADDEPRVVDDDEVSSVSRRLCEFPLIAQLLPVGDTKQAELVFDRANEECFLEGGAPDPEAVDGRFRVFFIERVTAGVLEDAALDYPAVWHASYHSQGQLECPSGDICAISAGEEIAVEFATTPAEDDRDRPIPRTGRVRAEFLGDLDRVAVYDLHFPEADAIYP